MCSRAAFGVLQLDVASSRMSGRAKPASMCCVCTKGYMCIACLVLHLSEQDINDIG